MRLMNKMDNNTRLRHEVGVKNSYSRNSNKKTCKKQENRKTPMMNVVRITEVVSSWHDQA